MHFFKGPFIGVTAKRSKFWINLIYMAHKSLKMLVRLDCELINQIKVQRNMDNFPDLNRTVLSPLQSRLEILEPPR